uniref:Uncharacterized protein n=1 Tax=Oryza brachyantha TaxID=4533 RepID=J3KYK9_ORYBR
MAERAPTAAVGEEHAMDTEAPASVAAVGDGRSAARVFAVLRSFLAVQQRRAEAYSTLRRYISLLGVPVQARI